MPKDKAALREEILKLVGEYHGAAFAPLPFVPGQSPVPVSGKVFDGAELQSLVDSSLDFWLTTGRWAKQFETRFARDIFGVKHALLVNSGSSANLVAVSALTSELLENPLRPGDEVITVATGFPTTVNPILQNRLVPVFVDVELPTYNIDVSKLEAALSPKTRALVIAHTLGNPFDLATVTAFAKKHSLYLVEDCCDAVGSQWEGRSVGTFGDIATTSFYPAHHITMGEGGCVLTSHPRLKRSAESFRDWGRDCWCDPGKDNTCGKRFDQQFGELPYGYDHKYVYSHIGYNLKMTDMQAAVGVAQLDKLGGFIAARRRNFDALKAGLRDLEEHLILPEALPQAQPSWFGFPLTLRPGSPVQRNQLIEKLEAAKIGTRLIFAGNIIRQPAYRHADLRVSGDLTQADLVVSNSFWLGVYPGLTPAHIAYMLETLHAAVKQLAGKA
jgi:CDP-6-deoxy-D-xylo-4-hexulose-3-dehydrase